MELFSKEVIGIVTSAVVVTAGGVFGLTKYINDQEVSVLKERIELETKRATDITERFNALSQPSSTITPPNISDPVFAEPETKKVLDRVKELEKEKSELIKKLSDAAVTSLDPKSEIRVLLQQLDQNVRVEETISTLFNIRSPATFEPMVSHFLKHSKGDLFVSGKSVREWLEYFAVIDTKAGLRFAVSQFNSYPEFVYSFLNNRISTESICVHLKPQLEQVALTSKLSEVRGKAKQLLVCDNVSEQPEPYTTDESELTNVRVYALLSKHGLTEDFHELTSRSNEIYYWSTSSFLYSKYRSTGDKQYIQALEDMAMLEMSSSSKSLTYIFLSKAHTISGSEERAASALELCQSVSVDVCSKLLGENEAEGEAE